MSVLRHQVIFVMICFLLSGMLTLKAERCGGLLEADKGFLDIQPSNSSCLWVLKLQKMTGMNLEIQLLTFEAIVLIPVHYESNASLQSTWISGPSKTYSFEGKMFLILSPPRNRKTSIKWTGITDDNFGVMLNAKFVATSAGNLQWQRMNSGIEQTLWAIEHEATGELHWTLSSDQLCCGHGNNTTQCISFDVINIMPDGSIDNINTGTCTASSVGFSKVEKYSKSLVILHIQSGVAADTNLQVTWKPVEHLKKNVKGVIVGTKSGLYVINLNPLQKTMLVVRKEIQRLAFDWNSKKMYWVEEFVGIMRANVDGSDYEPLILDISVTGVQIEPITGNLYYGTSTSQRQISFRVCSNDGKKCSTIANDYADGIAFHSSKGLLFWSNYTTMFRANLDGSNATEIRKHKSGAIRVDEREDRLYFSDGRTVMSCDLNGHDVRALTDITRHYFTDLDVAGDKVYFMGDRRLFFNTKQGNNLTLLAEQLSDPKTITLFGKLLSARVSNPCEKAKCVHLCVLINTSSYRCLCPDGEKLQEDGVSCD